MSYLGDVVEWLGQGEHWRGDEGVPARFWEHVRISGVSLATALAIALPIGLVLGHFRRGGFLAITLANLGRAVPAVSILLLAVLTFGIGHPPSYLTRIGVESIPAFLTLVALAIPPILTNTYVGVAGVDADVRDAARGMGMSGGEMLRGVELPLAAPLIMAGVRTSAVAVVATATLLAFVGGGGLGRFIRDRLGYDDPRVFVGALFVALLSVVVELALAGVERAVVPRPLRDVRDAPPLAPDERSRVAA